MSDEPSLLTRGIAIMEYRKKMKPLFTEPENERKALTDFENKLKRGKKRAIKKSLDTINIEEDDE